MIQTAYQLANTNMTDPATEYHPWVSEIQLEVPQLGPKLEPCAHKTSKYANKKRLVICCDGTWNNSSVILYTTIGARKKVLMTGLLQQPERQYFHQCCPSIGGGRPQMLHRHAPDRVLPPRCRHRGVQGCKSLGRSLRKGDHPGRLICIENAYLQAVEL